MGLGNAMIRFFLVVALGFFVFSEAIFACECIGVERPCEHLRVDAVFVGQVIDTVPVQRPVDKNSYTFGYSMHFSVDESLRGALGSDVTIQTGNGGGDCGTPLPPGQKFLIFAYREKGGQLWTGMCSGNQLLAGTVADTHILEPYRTLAKTHAGSIFGRVVFSKPKWSGDDVIDNAPPKGLKGVVLRASSATFTSTTRTSTGGLYEFDQLPNGKYTVIPERPSRFDYDHDDEGRYEADVSDGGCANIAFKLEPTTRIRGHLTLPAGLQLKLIQVTAVPIGLKELNQFSGKWDLTDENNRFDLWPLPPGDYYVGVNISSSPKAEAPFPPTYYPGVTSQQAAKVVRVKEGEIAELELTLPEVAKTRTVHFVAIGLDGKPLRKIYIQLEDLRHPGDASSYVNVDLDETGAGSLTIYSRYSYHLHGSVYVGQGDWCSEPVVIQAGGDPIEARFVMDRKAMSCTIRDIDHPNR
jgi:hypothetical protein